MFLYREAVHVPLVVRLPGGAGGGTRVAGTASQVDVAATIVDLARLDAAAMDGVSLRAALATGRVAAARPVYSETFYPRYHFGWSELFAVTDDRYRYIRAPRAELYDLGADPGEKTNLHGERTATAAAMGAWLEKAVRLDQVSAPEAVPAETREKLQALGYIGGGAPVVEGGELPDPKDKIGAYEDLRRALGLQRAGRGAEAVAAFRKVLAENPRMLDAWQSLGTTLIGLGRDREGIQALDKALEIDPSQADVHLALARVHALGGDRERATRHAEIASARDPGKGYEALAQLMLDKGRAADAAAFARKSIAADPARAMSHFILGVLAQAARPEEALASFRRAEEAIRLRRHAVIRNLHANMADCLARLGREAEAEREFLAEIEAIPHSREARRGLATLYWSQRRDAAARSVLAGLVQAEPRPSADTYWTVVETFSVLGDRSSAREWAGRARALFPSDPRFR
jgi:tetratricopeptide (TPR) repeat protein